VVGAPRTGPPRVSPGAWRAAACGRREGGSVGQQASPRCPAIAVLLLILPLAPAGAAADGTACLNPVLSKTGTVVVLNRRSLVSGRMVQENRAGIRVAGPAVFNGNQATQLDVTGTITAGDGAGVTTRAKTYLRLNGAVEDTFGGTSDLIPPPGTGTAVYSPPRRGRFDLAVGASFTQTVTETMTITGSPTSNGSHSRSQTTTRTFLGFEDVSVPAGTFAQACKWRDDIQVSDAPGVTTTATEWVARQSGLPLRTLSGASDQVLLSASINGVPVTP